MMGKSRSMEDRSAVSRMAGGKSWCNSHANTEVCQACGIGTRSEAHALRSCTATEIKEARRKWTGDISKVIAKVRNRDLKGLMEDAWTKMRNYPGGEMAMMGSFQPRWVENIHKGRMDLRDGEERIVMNIFKQIGQGARELIKLYRNHVGKENGSKELRQTNIRGYYGKRKGKLKVMGSVPRGEQKNKENKGKGYNEAAKGVIPEMNFTVFVEEGIIYWEFKKG